MSGMLHALERAIRFAGSQTALAAGINTSQQVVSNWLKSGTMQRCAPEFAIPIEKFTANKVTRYDLRPDIFGPAPGKS